MITFSCTSCGKTFDIDDDLAGRQGRCKQCGAVIRIPSPEPVLALLPRLLIPAPAAAIQRKRKRKQKARELGTINRDAWISLGVGSILMAIALAFPPLGFVIQILMTVIHELGHTATAWLFASPAAPSFDLSYGGGLSLILPRQPLLVIVAYLFFAFLLFRARDNRFELVKWSLVAVLYSVAMFTPLRVLLITAAGHGSELVFPRIFLLQSLRRQPDPPERGTPRFMRSSGSSSSWPTPRFAYRPDGLSREGTARNTAMPRAAAVGWTST